jgi:hypothetical protein
VYERERGRESGEREREREISTEAETVGYSYKIGLRQRRTIWNVYDRACQGEKKRIMKVR